MGAQRSSFTHLMELEVRGFVASMFAFAKELVCFSSLQVVEDDTFITAELHTVIIKKCNDCFNPSKSFLRSAMLCTSQVPIESSAKNVSIVLIHSMPRDLPISSIIVTV